MSWRWSSAPCVSDDPDLALTVNGYGIAYGSRVFVWSRVTAAATADGAALVFEYALDGAPWTKTRALLVVLDDVATASWHTFELRVAVDDACAAVASNPIAHVTWYEVEPPPGVPAVHSGPPATTASAYADFSFNVSTLLQLVTLQYSLDGSSWSGCDTTMRLGPLSGGAHRLRLRTVAAAVPGVVVNGSGQAASAAVEYNWNVTSLSGSTIALKGLSDGRHSLQVVARDAVGHVEAQPLTKDWVVDTVPPTTLAIRLSAPLTNASTGVVAAAGAGEMYPWLCRYAHQRFTSRRFPTGARARSLSASRQTRD